jgi:hypothetical protein
MLKSPPLTNSPTCKEWIEIHFDMLLCSVYALSGDFNEYRCGGAIYSLYADSFFVDLIGFSYADALFILLTMLLSVCFFYSFLFLCAWFKFLRVRQIIKVKENMDEINDFPRFWSCVCLK